MHPLCTPWGVSRILDSSSVADLSAVDHLYLFAIQAVPSPDIPGASSRAQIANRVEPRDGTARERNTTSPKANSGAPERVATGVSELFE